MYRISNYGLELLLTIEQQDSTTIREIVKGFTAEPSSTAPTLIVTCVLLTVLNADNAMRDSNSQRETNR